MVSTTTSYNALWILQQVVKDYTLNIFNALLMVTIQKTNSSLLQNSCSQMISNSTIDCAYKVCNKLSIQKVWVFKKGKSELLVGE